MTEDQRKIEIVDEKILTSSDSKPLFSDIIKNSTKTFNKDIEHKGLLTQHKQEDQILDKLKSDDTVKQESMKDTTDDKKQSFFTRKNVITIAIIVVIAITIIAVIGCLYYVIIGKKHKEELLVLTTDLDNYKKELTKKQTEQQNIIVTFQDEKKRLEDQIMEMDNVIKSQEMSIIKANEELKRHMQQEAFKQRPLPPPKQQQKPRKPHVKFAQQSNDDSEDGLEEFKQDKQRKQQPKKQQVQLEDNEFVVEHQEFSDAPIVEKEKQLTATKLTKKLINGNSVKSVNNKLMAIQQQEQGEEQEDYDREQQKISKELGLTKNVVNEDKLREAVSKMENVVDEQISNQHKEDHEQPDYSDDDSEDIGLGIDDKIDESLIATN